MQRKDMPAMCPSPLHAHLYPHADPDVPAGRVAIVGAGPVGLSLALALARRGVGVDVFEMLDDLSPEARASTFHPSTLEMFAEWGVADDLIAAGFRVETLQYWERETGSLIAQFDYRAIAHETAYPFRLQCPQSVLTRLLRPKLEALANVRLHMGHTFTHFDQDGDGVTVHCTTASGPAAYRAGWLCAADGSRSAVRAQLGLGFAGMTYEDRFLLIATDADLSRTYPGMTSAAYIFDPHEWVIVLHLPDVTRIVFQLRPDEDRDAVQAEAAVRARIARFVGAALDYTIRATSVYAVHQRVADTFRVGRVLLLGDAAHINNPMGGMGMNSGIHDAWHLADALGRVLAGGPDTLLDGYAERRRRFALESVQASTDRNYRDMAATDADYRVRRNAWFRSIAADPAKMRAYLLHASMFPDAPPLIEPAAHGAAAPALQDA